MLTFVCWKWRKPSTGYQLPNVCAYTAGHVNTLERMLRRHVRLPHRLVCLTDDPAGIRCQTHPVPQQYAELGGCYRRLWMFSREAVHLLGPRFVSIDLDCVMVRDCTPLFDRPEDLVLNAYNPARASDPDQHYNGGLMLISAGCRPQVWEEFDPVQSPRLLAERARAGECIGTDQAWLRVLLGKGEARWTNADGVFERRQLKHGMDRRARLVMFAGARDPSCDQSDWVRRFWR